MSTDAPQPSDALVFFGATGDLAYKQIFPSLLRPGARRRPERAHRRRRQGRLGPGPAEGTREGQPGASRPDRSATDGKAAVACCATSMATTPIRRPSRKLHKRTRRRRSGRCTIWRCRPACSAPWPRRWRSRAPPHDARLVIEKPFGHNRATAQAAERRAAKVLPRGEHLPHRPLSWARSRCRTCSTRASPTRCSSRSGTATTSRSIQITMAEDFGVQDRGRFYDETGAIRDVLQNHLLQVLAQLTMDPPTGEEHEAHARPEGRAAEGGAPARSRPCGARPVRRLSQRARRARRLDRRDLRRGQAVHRKLAVGGRADLHPRRQDACR